MQLLKIIKWGQYRFRLFNPYVSNKVKNENDSDAIRNRISDCNKWRISQPKTNFPACILKNLAEFLRLRSVWKQNRNSAGRYWH